MAVKRRANSSVSIVQVLAMVVLVLVALIGLAFILAPRKPVAPPTSRITYELRPEERTPRPSELRSDGSVTEVARMEEEPLETPAPEVLEAMEEIKQVLYIRGLVMSASERTPIRGAQVVAVRKHTAEDNVMLATLDEGQRKSLRAQLSRPNRARVDDKGAFELELQHAGVYEVAVTAQSYVPYKTETTYLGEDVIEARVEALLSRGATISGRVVEAGTNIGAAGLRVQVESVQGPFDVTDNDGNYSVTGLAPGEYGVAVDLSGSPYMAGHHLPYQRVKIAEPDQRVANIDFTVDAAGVVWGYVLSPNQDPISQANVTLASSQSMIAQALSSAARQAAPVTFTTSDDGYYELTGVPLNEQWRIHAITSDYAPQLSDPFLLSGAQRNVRIDLYMFAGTNVYGQVVSGDNKPVPGAEIMCIPAYGKFFTSMTAPQAFRSASTDGNGMFTLNELPAGEYQIFAQRQGFKVSPIGYPIYPDGYSDLRNVRITLRGVDEGQHTVYGVVADDRGRGLDGVNLRLAGVSLGGLEGSDRSATTSGNGTFRFDGVSAGQYTIVATADGFSPTTVRRVRLNEETRITLRQTAVVRGRVVIQATSEPPELYTVGAYPISESTGNVNFLGMMGESAMTEQFFAPDGSFEIVVNAGPYRIEASAEGFTPARTEIVVEAGETRDDIVLSLDEKGGRISGTVYASDGGSIQGAKASLLEASSPAEALMMLASQAVPEDRVQRVGDDGSFTFESLPASEYVIIAEHPGYPNAQSELIFLAEGDNRDNIRIRFSAGGAIEGYVYREGQPVPDAVVLVVGNGITEHSNADQTGYYYLDGLAAGVYQAMVTDLSSGDLSSVYDARGVQLTVEEGVATRYDFGTTEGGRIEGRCIPGPINMLGGRAVLQRPGFMQAPLGETVEVTQLMGQSVGINPAGMFVMEDVMPGEWQLDIFYFELGVANPLDVRYVHTELVMVEQGEVVTVNLPVSY